MVLRSATQTLCTLASQPALNKYLGMPNFDSALLAALLAWGALTPLSGVIAQSVRPLVTDRPDQTESAAVVPRGTFQLEFGAMHAFDEPAPSAATRLMSLGAALLRVGLAPPLELRLGFAGWHRATAEAGPTEHGLGDLDFGAKAVLHRGTGPVPSVALLGTVTLPTGHEAFRASGPDPEVRLAVSQELPAGFGLGYNVAAAWTTEADAAGDESFRTDLLYTAVLGRALTDRVAAFVEGFGSLVVSEGGSSWHALDAGLTLALRTNLQLDLSGGLGLSDAAEDWFVGAGVSVRMPR